MHDSPPTPRPRRRERSTATGVTARFTDQVIAGIRQDAPTVPVTRLETAAARHEHTGGPPSLEATRYFALCDRAWLHWTRPALTNILNRALRQAPTGPFNPHEVRNATQASEAARRCALHWRLLNIAGDPHEHAEWGWELEAARHVHASTRNALSVAAAINRHQVLPSTTLQRGIDSAAEALVAAAVAGFIDDAADELTRTLDAMIWADIVNAHLPLRDHPPPWASERKPPGIENPQEERIPTDPRRNGPDRGDTPNPH